MDRTKREEEEDMEDVGCQDTETAEPPKEGDDAEDNLADNRATSLCSESKLFSSCSRRELMAPELRGTPSASSNIAAAAEQNDIDHDGCSRRRIKPSVTATEIMPTNTTNPLFTLRSACCAEVALSPARSIGFYDTTTPTHDEKERRKDVERSE